MNDHTPNTSTLSPLVTGDVIELDLHDETISALVLLATDQALILDACDGSTPFVVKRDELGPHRRFNPID